jgi:hypothetical protein
LSVFRLRKTENKIGIKNRKSDSIKETHKSSKELFLPLQGLVTAQQHKNKSASCLPKSNLTKNEQGLCAARKNPATILQSLSTTNNPTISR